MEFVTQIMGFIDGAVASAAQNIFVNIATNYGGVVVMLATIAMAIFGLSIAMGASTVRVQDFMQLLMRIVLVFIFGLSWASFQVIYDTLTGTGDALVSAVFGAARGVSSSALQSAGEFSDTAQSAASKVIQAESSITRGILGGLMYVLLAGLMAVYVLVAGFAKMMIAILIGLAPFAIAATILQRTQFLFEAWLSSLIGYFLYPVAAAGVMGFIATVGKRAFEQSAGSSTLIGITGVIVLIIVGILALKSIPQIASNITGQINLAGIAPEALRIAGAPISKAASQMKAMGSQFASGFSTGGETKQRAEQSRRYGSRTDMAMANLGARAANNSIGRAIQRRRSLEVAREANAKIRRDSSKKLKT